MTTETVDAARISAERWGMDHRIETAGDADIWDAQVMALLRTAFAGMEGRIDPPSSLHRMGVEDVARQRREGTLLLAIAGDVLIGCVFLSRRDDHAYLGKLAVAPDWTRRGIARTLVERAAEFAQRPILRLETRIELVENHAAFARMGFVEMGRTAHPGYSHPTSLTMERRL